MKVSIRKYDGGGGFSLPFVDYMPFEGLDSGVPASTADDSSKKSSEDDLGVKDILKLANSLDGLPSDITKITSMIGNMYLDASLFNNGKLTSDTLVTLYLSALLQIKVAGFNKEQFQQAKNEVIKNGGLHEAAIDEYGNLLVLNNENGKIERMSLKEYYGKANEYSPLTNSNLLYYRSNNKQLAFDNRLLDVVSNGIGEEKITKMILQTLSGIGSDQIKKEGFTLKQAGDIQAGLELLALAHDEGFFNKTGDLMPIDSLYKMGLATKDLLNLINMAMNYLIKAMPANARTWLQLRSGNMENPAQGAKEMLAQLMFAHDSSTKEFTITPAKDPNKKEADPLSDMAKQDKINPYISMQKLEGGTQGTFELNKGTNNSLMVDGTVYGNIQSSDWKPIGNTSMANFMNGGLSGIVENMNGISFGNRVISPEDLNNIMYDNGGGIMVNLPCKIVNGAKVVDLEVLDQYQKAYETFKLQQANSPNPDKLFGLILEDYGLTELLDENGLPNKSRFNQFLVVTGYAVDKNHKFIQDNNGDENTFIEEVNTNDEALVDLIEKSLSTKNANDATKRDYKIDTENWFESSSPNSAWFTYDHIYKGSLYIPISNNEAQGHNAGKQELPYAIMHLREYEYQLNLKRRQAQSASADLLNM